MKISSSLSLKFRCRIEFLSVSNRHYMYFIKPLPHTDFSHVRVRKFKFCFLYNSPIFCFLFSSESYNGELNVVNMEICANFPVLGTLTYLNETCTAALICTGSVGYCKVASFKLLVSSVVTNNFTFAVDGRVKKPKEIN